MRAFFKSFFAAGLVWVALLWLVPAAHQAHVFYQDGASAFEDYRMPQMCVASAKTYEPDGLARHDAPYPALGYAVARAFPRDTLKGGMLFTAFSILVLLAGAWLLTRSGWAVAATVFMAPVLHAIGLGNQIVLTLGGVLVFLAWKDERGWKKSVAFLALAAASALKILPAVFGLALVKERRWRDCLALGFAGALLAFVPFAWFGGLEGLAAFVGNLHLHADHYGPLSRFGFVPIDRSIRLLAGLPVSSIRATFALDRVLNLGLVCLCLLTWWRTRCRAVELLMLAAVAVCGSSVAQYYAGMYLLPAVLLWGRERPASGTEKLLFFLALCPLQFPWANGGVNILMTDFCLLLLAGLSFFRCERGS